MSWTSQSCSLTHRHVNVWITWWKWLHESDLGSIWHDGATDVAVIRLNSWTDPESVSLLGFLLCLSSGSELQQVGATAACVPLCGQTGGGGGCYCHTLPPAQSLPLREKERMEKKRLRDRETLRRSGRERERERQTERRKPFWFLRVPHLCCSLACFCFFDWKDFERDRKWWVDLRK